MKEDWFARRRRQLSQMNEAEAAGRVADSMEIRAELVRKMHAGEMTLEQVQAELKRIKRNAKKNGLITRDQAYRGK